MQTGPSCLIKKETHPLICGLHNVPVVQDRFPIDSNAPELGFITCYVCPVSREILSDPATQKKGNH
jgi:hypothetical protein